MFQVGFDNIYAILIIKKNIHFFFELNYHHE